jgi:hypothetical protein
MVSSNSFNNSASLSETYLSLFTVTRTVPESRWNPSHRSTFISLARKWKAQTDIDQEDTTLYTLVTPITRGTA